MLPTRNLDRAGKITVSDSRPWRTQSLTVTCFLQDRLATIRKLCHGTRSVPDQRNPSLHNQRASRRLRGNFKLKKKSRCCHDFTTEKLGAPFPTEGESKLSVAGYSAPWGVWSILAQTSPHPPSRELQPSCNSFHLFNCLSFHLVSVAYWIL